MVELRPHERRPPAPDAPLHLLAKRLRVLHEVDYPVFARTGLAPVAICLAQGCDIAVSPASKYKPFCGAKCHTRHYRETRRRRKLADLISDTLALDDQYRDLLRWLCADDPTPFEGWAQARGYRWRQNPEGWRPAAKRVSQNAPKAGETGSVKQ